MCPRILTTFALALAFAACGTTSGPRDGGATGDGGPPADAGPRITDGGCTPDGGCPSSGCLDVTGTYKICANCGPLGTFGPFNTEVVHTCGCQIQGCAVTDGGADGGRDCGTGCIDLSDNLTVSVRAGSLTVTCTGPYASGGTNMTCDLGPFGSCAATMVPGTGTTCP
jgi:hypothetical protein